MSVLSCAHVHTTYCDGKTPAAEMAKRAWELGFVSLGFSSFEISVIALVRLVSYYCISCESRDVAYL